MEESITKVKLLPEEAMQVHWRARWLQSRELYGKPFHHTMEYRRSIDSATQIRNIHTMYRKHAILLNGNVRCARLYVTADDVYKLYFDEEFIDMGPAQSALFDYHYHALDVTAYVIGKQELMIAAHVYYQGLLNLAYLSADYLEGFLFQLEITYEDGSMQRIISDASWKCWQCKAWSGTRTLGYTTQFTEDVDMRKYPHGWKGKWFDDSEWEPALVGAAPYPMFYTMTPRRTPPLHYVVRKPKKVTKTEDGRLLFDFGQEYTAFTVLKMQGERGQIVAVRHAEEMEDETHIRYQMRCNCEYQEFVTLSGELDTIEFYDYKGFRYLEIVGWENAVEDCQVWILNSYYPIGDGCRFTSSDKLLNQIWEICRNGVQQGTQDTYLDCPTREKGGFLGDAYITAFSHLYLSNDPRILKKMLLDFANKLRLYPGMTANAPNYIVGDLADYSLLWPEILLKYYQWTADRTFVEEMLFAVDTLAEYFAGYEDANGLVCAIHNRLCPESESILVDWPPNVRYDYHFEEAKQGVCTLINLLYYGFCKHGAQLYQIAGDEERAKAMLEKTEALEEACIRYLYCKDKGLFVDVLGETSTALHANPPAMLFGRQLPNGYGAIRELIRKNGLRCGVYYAYFMIQGLYNAGYADLAYELITSHDQNSWFSMLEAGATTCMEVWHPDLKWNTSWCHPWSSSPIIWIVEQVMGIASGGPGWSSIRIQPQVPTTLSQASLTLSTPAGELEASFVQTGQNVSFRVTLTQENQVCLSLPESVQECTVDGKEVALTAKLDAFGVTHQIAYLQWLPGNHTVCWTRS